MSVGSFHNSGVSVSTMRDVFGVGSSRKLDRPFNNIHSGGPEVDMKKSSIPGYLELTDEKINRLICQEPIENFYEVEDHPFAR